MISKFLHSQPQISKKILDQSNIFFLTVGQNNFGNKIPFLFRKKYTQNAKQHVILVKMSTFINFMKFSKTTYYYSKF